MARWVAGGPQGQAILDPAAGLGVFFRAILKVSPSPAPRLVGYEIDPSALSEARRLFQAYPEERVRLEETDYLLAGWEARYGGVILNPPYRRFQHYRNRKELLQEFREHLGVRLSGLTNLASLFLLKSVSQLSEGGRCACILPSEFLNADYGQAVKELLVRLGGLRYVIVFDFQGAVFERVITTACILLFASDALRDTVEFLTLDSPVGANGIRPLHGAPSLEDLGEKLSAYPSPGPVGKVFAHSQLDCSRKWRVYYQGGQPESPFPAGLISPAVPQLLRQPRNLAPFSAYARVMRGIATGDNRYFTFNLDKKERCGIEAEFLLPCLSKAAQARRSFFTHRDFDELAQSGKNVCLLNAPDHLDNRSPAQDHLSAYLRYGESQGVHLRYLTAHRRPWYALEDRPPAPLLVTVFSRGGLRFVRNEAGVYNLTCFHSIYVKEACEDKTDLLTAYLLTRVARALLLENRREYGDGLQKLEPNDLSSAFVLDLYSVPAGLEAEILALFHAYRHAVLERRAVEPHLAGLERIFQKLLLS